MSRFSYSVLNFVQELENAASCNSLDTSDTGSYGVFADYLEQSQTSGVVDMSTAAELNGNALCLNNSYDIAVLSPNRAIAPSFLASSMGISVMVTGIASNISLFTIASISESCSGVTASK